MKQLLMIAVALMVTATQAKADGFVCETEDGTLKVQIYNKTHPYDGTRNPAVMVLSDKTVNAGNKTIATFETGETLSGGIAAYVANVDLRYKNSNRKGELILGTKLGELDTITVEVDFSYSSPLEDGEISRGLISAVKRDGEVVEENLVCARYLKGE